MQIFAISHISFDGVVQAPGRPDEDTRDGFDQGGRSVPYRDSVMTEDWGEVIPAGLQRPTRRSFHGPPHSSPRQRYGHAR
jgi:hypothetical protein